MRASARGGRYPTRVLRPDRREASAAVLFMRCPPAYPANPLYRKPRGPFPGAPMRVSGLDKIGSVCHNDWPASTVQGGGGPLTRVGGTSAGQIIWRKT